MKDFYFIPHKEIINNAANVMKLLSVEGCEWAADREGLIVKPNSRAHIQAHLLEIDLLKGIWEDPVEV